MKIVLRIIGVFLAVVIGAVIFANHHLGSVINTVAVSVGPKATGGAVKVEQVKFALLRGKITISGLLIGNPEGFKTDSALELSQVAIDFEPRSLLSDTIHIRSILIEEGVKLLGDGATAVGKGALEAGEAVGGAALKGVGETVEANGARRGQGRQRLGRPAGQREEG